MKNPMIGCIQGICKSDISNPQLLGDKCMDHSLLKSSYKFNTILGVLVFIYIKMI